MCRRRDHSLPEEVASSHGAHEVAALRCYRRRFVFEFPDRKPSLFAVKCACERSLPRTSGTRVSRAKSGQRSSPGNRVRERVSRERVANPDVVIQIRQRGDRESVVIFRLYDHREPESQFAQPDGGGIDVDAED